MSWCRVQTAAAVTGQGCPLVRSKHAMCAATDGRIYLYGGKSLLNQALRDLWRFDPDLNRWEQMTAAVAGSAPVESVPAGRCQTCRSDSRPRNLQVDSSSTPPPPLQEHTIVSHKNKLYVFGGEIGYSSDETPLWMLDLELTAWRKYSPSRTLAASIVVRPLGRRGHTAVVYQNLMCIYGGYQDIKGSTSEIWTFNLDTEEWYMEGGSSGKGPKDAAPLPRHGHSAVVHHDSMYVYGGMSNLHIRGDFWAWKFKSKQWNRVKGGGKGPGELSFHSAIVVLDSMYIYGGERSNGSHTNELWRYWFGNQTWEHIEIKGIAPSCRTRHVAVANPLFKLLESKTIAAGGGGQKSTKIKRHRQHHRKKEEDGEKESKEHEVEEETSFAESTKSPISLCFHHHHHHPRKSLPSSPLSSVFSFNGSVATTKSKEEEFTELPSSNSAGRFVHQTSEPYHSDLATKNSKIAESGKTTIQRSMEEQENANPNIPIDHGSQNDQSGSTSMDNQTATATLVSGVKMRPRRPTLQKQRPYSDFYDASVLLKQTNPDEFEELNNEFQFKRRSVQESMSYYSLCFPTPPAHLQRQKVSPGRFALFSPLNTPKNEDNDNKTGDKPDSTDPVNNLYAVKMRENFVSSRRVRKQALELDLSILDMYNSAPVPVTAAGNQRHSALYSLTLDISPDFEKELKFSTAGSTPTSSSNELNLSLSVSTDDHHHYDGYESMEMTHLDMLEDYLEPEEMLEIVTESATGQEMSSSLNIKQIQRTPGPVRKHHHTAITSDKNQKKEKKALQPQQPPAHQSSAASVSHSSSGYQSLIFADSNANNSFDIITDPSSISNSSSFGEPGQPNPGGNKREFDHLSPPLDYIELKPMTAAKMAIKDAATKVREPNKARPHHHHHNRLSHWEPNISKEIIEEVVPVPNSPPDTESGCGSETELAAIIGKCQRAPKETTANLRGSQPNNHRAHSDPIFCMYVFGGKEDCITGVLNKQSMTVWKYYA